MSVIKVKNISKKYNSYIQNEINDTIQENILSIIKNPFTLFKKQKKNDFWALKNISFNIFGLSVILTEVSPFLCTV